MPDHNYFHLCYFRNFNFYFRYHLIFIFSIYILLFSRLAILYTGVLGRFCSQGPEFVIMCMSDPFSHRKESDFWLYLSLLGAA